MSEIRGKIQNKYFVSESKNEKLLFLLFESYSVSPNTSLDAIFYALSNGIFEIKVMY